MLRTRWHAVLIAASAVGASLISPAARADGTGPEVFAGTGTAGSAGDGGAAAAAQLNHPTGVAVAADGTVYLSDGGNHRVRAVAPDGTISTVAGSGRAGTAGAPVPDAARGTDVDLSLPQNLAVGPGNTLYIADPGLSMVFALAADGRLSVLAGTGTRGPAGDGGPATRAALGVLGGLAAGPDGTVYIGDLQNHRVRAVSPDGTITTVAGNGGETITAAGGAARTIPVPDPSSLAVDAQGTVWIGGAGLVRRLSGGQLATVTRPGQLADQKWALSTASAWPPDEPPLNNISAVAAAGDGVYALDQQQRVVVRLAAGNGVESLASLDSVDGPVIGPIAVAKSGVGYLVASDSHKAYSFRLTTSSAEDGGSPVPRWPFVAAGVVLVAAGGWLVMRRLR